MKNINRIAWGVVIIAAGVIFALNALDIADINIFFDGWWTLFIIIPCLVGLFTEREKLGNAIGVAFGVFLLLACQEVLGFDLLWKLIVPAAIVLFGFKLVLSGLFGNKTREIVKKIESEGAVPRKGRAIFSGCDMNFAGEIFEGAQLTAIFGGAECDLRGAIIEKDCVIRVSVAFGGIDILVPDNIHVKVDSTVIFGGVSNKAKRNNDNGITLYIVGNCLFGGVDVK